MSTLDTIKNVTFAPYFEAHFLSARLICSLQILQECVAEAETSFERSSFSPDLFV